MKLIVMPVAKLTPAPLNGFAEDLLQKVDDAAADFPAAPVATLTTHQGELNGLLNQRASLASQMDSLLLQIEAKAVSVRDDCNTLGEWFESTTQDPVKLAKVATLRSSPQASGPTPQVQNLHLSRADNVQHSDAAWDSLGRDAKSYEVQSCVNPLNNDPNVGPWVTAWQGTKSSATIGPYAAGARIWVKVRAIGVNGPGDWSDPATIIVP